MSESGPNSGAHPVAGELSRPVRREASFRGTCRVTFPAGPSGPAIIMHEGGEFAFPVPPDLVKKRFARGEAEAWFKFEIVDGVIELGERVPDRGRP